MKFLDMLEWAGITACAVLAVLIAAEEGPLALRITVLVLVLVVCFVGFLASRRQWWLLDKSTNIVLALFLVPFLIYSDGGGLVKAVIVGVFVALAILSVLQMRRGPVPTKRASAG